MMNQTSSNIELDSTLRKLNLTIDNLKFEIAKASAAIVQAQQEFEHIRAGMEQAEKDYEKEFERLARVI